MSVGGDLDLELLDLRRRVALLEARPTDGIPGPQGEPGPMGPAGPSSGAAAFPDIKSALVASLSAGPVSLGGRKYTVTQPVEFTIGGFQRPWGISDFTLEAGSGFPVGQPLLTFNFDGGNASSLEIRRCLFRGAGLKFVSVNGGNGYQYVLDSVRVRDFRGHAFHFLGTFEGRIIAPFVEGIAGTNLSGDGMRFESSGQGGGLVSSVDIISPDIRFANIGVHLVNPTRDVCLMGGYIGHNWGAGARLGNGLASAWVNVDFESNNRGGGRGEIDADTNVRLLGCTFYMAQSKAPVAVHLASRGTVSSVMMCARSGGGTAGHFGLQPGEMTGNSGF